jgi:two-component system, chemotaxis family, protein-glutamate methylesterase/glutaminase
MSAAPSVEAIAIGGSAGALEGLLTLLKAVPADFRPSLLIVVHVPPDRPSLLWRVLGEQSRLPVREALDKERIEPGVAYVAPPDYHMLVERPGELALSRDEPVAFSRPSIDVMFESAAEAYGPQLLGIVLSGANADGAAGLAAIRKGKGRAWVQDPANAQASAMPAAAIAKAGADLVLAIDDMAERLAHLRSGSAAAL